MHYASKENALCNLVGELVTKKDLSLEDVYDVFAIYTDGNYKIHGHNRREELDNTMRKFEYSDEVGAIAIRTASKTSDKLRPALTREQENDNYVKFAVRTVRQEKEASMQHTAIIRRLGTFAESDKLTDTDARNFCTEIARIFGNRFPFDTTYEFYRRYREHLLRGTMVTPMISCC